MSSRRARGRKPSAKHYKAMRSTASKTYVKRAISRSQQTYHGIIAASAQSAAYDTEYVDNLTDFTAVDSQELHPSGLTLRYRIIPVDATEASIMRVIVFVWKSNTADGVPVLEDIMSQTAGVNSVNDTYQDTESERSLFRILYDKRHNVPANAVGNGPLSVLGFVRIPKKRLPAKIGNVGGTGFKNNIYLLAFSDMQATNEEPTISYVSDLSYKT